MPPLILDVATAFKDGLLQREAAQMAEAARRWLVVERTLQDSIDALAYELANTGTPTMGMLSRSARYQALRRQIAAELDKYAQYMDGRITDGQRNAVSLALDYSAASINAAAESQMVIPFNRLPVSATENLIGMAGNGSPLIDVLNDATQGAADRMGERLIAGLALGKNPLEVARQAIRLGLGTSFTRMQTIARTEMLRAAREATLQSYRASNVVRAYRRLSARDRRTCAGCLFADGQIYDLGESFDQHPNCRCALLPVLRNVPPIQYETGREWFTKQPADVQQAILGPSRLAAFNNGKISFDDIISRTSNKIWGGTITTKSVKALGIPTVASARIPRAPSVRLTPRRGAPRPSAPVSTEAARLQQAWVHGSNQRSSIVLKEAVRNEFGVRRGIVYNPRGHEVTATEIATARPAVREMYEKTQAHFREQGITELKLYRGVKSEINVHGVLESWTSDLKTARKFNGHDVMEQTIPVERVLLAHNGPGWKNGRYGQQYEFVVMP